MQMANRTFMRIGQKINGGPQRRDNTFPPALQN